MSHLRFDILTFPLDGTRLIEASAGTGKTFSLAGLYLRLLVEKQLGVRDILVMTFTRAATQELRERIRTRLAEAARLAHDPRLADPQDREHTIALAVIDRAAASEPRERIARRLRDAAARMDDATISTIHAFAQQAAQENAFDSGLAFDRGEQVDDAGVQRDAARDAWRSEVLGRSPAEAAAFRELWPDPERFARDILPAVAQPHLLPLGPSGADLDTLTARARTLWLAEHEALRTLLTDAFAEDALLKAAALHKMLDTPDGVPAFMARIETGLAGTASGFAVVPALAAALGDDTTAAALFKKQARGRFRPQDLALTRALAALAPVAHAAALRRAITRVRTTVQTRKAARRHFSFADMIESLHAAITDPVGGPVLASALHHTWPYALVDEFQDTDPRQYDILQRIYAGRDTGALVLIGDPKQAIYAFRGGDVFAYLAAARDAGSRHELDTNFRSTRGVLDGIGALFLGPADSHPHGPFLLADIRFHPVAGGRRPDDRVVRQRDAPVPAITAWALDGTDIKSRDARRLLLDATVGEICALLDPVGGARVHRSDGRQDAVCAGDIAVLVNTNQEAATVQRALARRGIAAVCLHRASVFESDEAGHLLLLLRAAERAARPEAVRAALTTPLFGLRLGDLLALDADEASWLATLGRFQAAHDDWRARGVLALLEPLLQAAAPRVLGLEDGERRMTNYLQLAELLAAAETTTFGPASLVRWLAEQIGQPHGDTEAQTRQLRLESDDALVRIATVHRVKGLQYPFVFLPFAPWLGARPPTVPWVFHDDGGAAWLDFGLAGPDGAGRAALESRAEALRLLYVALTRAEQACYLGWGSIRTAQNSALAWLLHAEDGLDPAVVDVPQKRLPDWFTGAQARARLDAWAARSNGAVVITAPPAALADGYRMPAGSMPTGNARSDLPARRPDWSVFSYSRLVAGGRAPSTATGADDEALDAAPDPRDAAPTDADTIGLRGPAFGTAVHTLLEAVDPATWPAPAATPDAAQLELVRRHLVDAGFVAGADAAGHALVRSVARLVARTVHTPLPHVGALARVPAERRLVEMEFFLTLGGQQVGTVLQYLAAHGYATALAAERRQQVLNGFMQGYVDLTVEADGRYWILDYKTNDLGAGTSCYRPEALARAVRHGHYDLQYLIYLVALHRHLGRTLADYAPARHLGGAQYLFLRGLNGADAATGVYIDTPPADFVQGLDALFAGASGER